MADQDEGNSFFKWLIAVGLPLLLLSLFVLHQQTKDAPTPQPPVNAARQMGDAEIATTLRQALHDSSTLSEEAKAVTVESKDGVVTLRGQAASSAEKSLIEKIAKNTNGVSKVNNEIEVR